jgi:uncharacterized protein YjbI with pentapeptide repeats
MTDAPTPAERDALLAPMRSKKREDSLRTLEAIRDRGWLTDGTLRGASLFGAKWQHADLRNADLRECTLSGVVLQGADLSSADFSGAEMIDSDLRGVRAHGAKFAGVDAIACKTSMGDFTDADFSGATFGNATFSFTRLHHTRLDDVDFNNAIFDNTILADVDLSSTRNLDSVRHYGPSAVDMATVLRSRVALDFWRGCGLPEDMLLNLEALRKTRPVYYPAYIAYAHPDRAFARTVLEGLRNIGVRCWLQEHQLEEHVDFYHALKLGIRAQDRVVLVCSQAALESWWIENQLQAALARAIYHGKGEAPAMIVLDVDAARQAGAGTDTVRERLATYPAVDFNAMSDQTAFAVQLEAVLKLLRR